MAMYENIPKRQYTQYKRHVNDSGERIDAKTVNKIQENILYCNSCTIDYFRDGEKINDNESNNINLDINKRQIQIKDASRPATFISQTIQSPHGSDIELNDFFLVVNHEIPVGSSIKYYIETYTGERWPLKANEVKLPLHLSKNITNGFTFIAELTPNQLDETPVINGYSVLYWDAQVEANYGLTNPDLMRFP